MNDRTIAVLERYLGPAIKSGYELVFECPFCIKKGHATIKRKLHVNVDSDKYNCFRCGERGLSVGSLMFALTGNKNYREEQIPGSRNYVYNLTREKLKKPVDEIDLWGTEAYIEEEMYPIYGDTTSTAERARKYLNNRGFSEKDIEHYNIHYGVKDKYANMVIFPVYLNGTLVFYSGRSFVTNDKAHPNKINAPTGKSGCLFNYDVAKNYKTIVLNEGIFDSHSCGKNAVAMFGKSLSSKQLELLRCTKAEEIVICIDPDALKEAQDIAKRIEPIQRVKISILTDGDANENHETIQEKIVTESEQFSLKTQVKMKLLAKKLKKG